VEAVLPPAAPLPVILNGVKDDTGSGIPNFDLRHSSFFGVWTFGAWNFRAAVSVQPLATRHNRAPCPVPQIPDPTSAVRARIDALYREESGRILASLIRLLGDFDVAEDAMHDAFSAALERWPRQGVPSNPRAWLISAGRFKAIDAIRRRTRFDASREEIASALGPQPGTMLDELSTQTGANHRWTQMDTDSVGMPVRVSCISCFSWFYPDWLRRRGHHETHETHETLRHSRVPGEEFNSDQGTGNREGRERARRRVAVSDFRVRSRPSRFT
jgi:hypothetical protein